MNDASVVQATLFDPSLLVVAAAFAGFLSLVVVAVVVMRWIVVRRNPELGDR